MKKIHNIALCVLMAGVMIFQSAGLVSADDVSDYYKYQGLSNLFLLGMVSNEDYDSALDLSGSTVYIPAGTYVIKKPIVVGNGNIIGAGMDKTIIIADFEDPKIPIIIAGSEQKFSDIQFRYKDGLVTGKEKEGERVGIFCEYVWSLQKGANLTNVKFSNVGTGLYSPPPIKYSSVGIGVGTEEGEKYFQGSNFSVTYDNLVVENFSFRGIDFSSLVRTGNLWRNIYLSSGKYECESAFCFQGEESECSIDLLTVADTRAEQPIVLDGARALDAGSIALRNVTLTGDNTAYIHWSGSSGYIGHLSMNDMKIDSLQAFVEVGAATYDIMQSLKTMNYLRVGTLTLSKVSGMTNANKFAYFRRESGYNEDYYITVNNYYYDADRLERDIYKSFPTSDESLIYTKKGQITTKGSTLLRPEYRLCPYYTKYEDTTLGKTLIWTGDEWK